MGIQYYKSDHKYALQRIDGDRRLWDHLGKHVIKVLVKDGQVVGFLAIRIEAGGLVLVKLVVDLGSRSVGHGTELHNELLRMARNNQKRTISTMVCERNDLGINFLRARGWLATGVSKRKFTNGSDGYNFIRDVIL